MRLKNTLRNTAWNLFGQMVMIITGLFVKRAMLLSIGTEKIGLNYLFNDIISLISIADLGLTGIIAYHLYKPLDEGNEVKVLQIMDFFRKAYFTVGIIVTMGGMGMIPFLELFVTHTTLNYGYISLIFIIFLIRNTESYFFSYQNILPYADQKEYHYTRIDIITTMVYSVVSIVVLYYTKSIIYVILLETLKKIINDLIMKKLVYKNYPFMRRRDFVPLKKVEIRIIGRDLKDAFLSKVSVAVIGTTDNIIISKFLGIAITGLFSNYAMVLYTVQTILNQLIKSAQSSMGNLLTNEKGKVVYSVTRKITFISFFLMSICGCCLYQVTTPFVALWFGTKYVMVQAIVFICVLNIFMNVIQLSMVQLSAAAGLFRQTKKIDFFVCSINVILSIIGVNIFGIVGIFLATFLSRIIEYYLKISLNFNQILLRKKGNYILQNIMYFLIFLLEIGILEIIRRYMHLDNRYLELIINLFIAATVPLFINISVYHASEDFNYMITIGKDYIYGLINKEKKGNNID